MKEDGTPFRTVAESILEMAIVMRMLKTMKSASIAPAFRDDADEDPETKNMSITAMSVGKRPLHGTKLLVSMAMRRSRGDSIILQPVTPQALQPNPMHMVRDCFPCAPQRLKA